jgi:hypothetical protein
MPCVCVSLSLLFKQEESQTKAYRKKKTKLKDNLQNSVMMAREGEECKVGDGHV